jgi:hypothetical protein
MYFFPNHFKNNFFKFSGEYFFHLILILLTLSLCTPYIKSGIKNFYTYYNTFKFNVYNIENIFNKKLLNDSTFPAQISKQSLNKSSLGGNLAFNLLFMFFVFSAAKPLAISINSFIKLLSASTSSISCMSSHMLKNNVP